MPQDSIRTLELGEETVTEQITRSTDTENTDNN